MLRKLKNVYSTVLILLFSTAICINVYGQNFPNPIKGNLWISAGAENQKENFRWSIAGNNDGEEPNILSELIFNPVQSVGFSLSGGYDIHQKISLELDYKKLFTYDGRVTDFDYDGDNRTDPSTKLFLSSDKGNRQAFSARVFFNIANNNIFLIKGGGGYTATKELFYLLDDNDPDLKSTYLANWKGPHVKLSGQWTTPLRIFVGTGFTFNYLNYDAEANWNSIEDFKHPVSFIQTATGTGWDFTIYTGYSFNNYISTSISWLRSSWKTDYGTDKLFLQSGETPTTRMNGAFKENSGWQLCLIYDF